MALDAIRGERTLAELAKLHDVHVHQIVDWKNQLMTRAAGVFGADAATAPAVDLKELHAKIGRLALASVVRNNALPPVTCSGLEDSTSTTRAAGGGATTTGSGAGASLPLQANISPDRPMQMATV